MAAAVQGALGAYQIAKNLISGNKAKKEAEIIERNKPIRRTSQFDKDALALTESELANGISSKAEQAYDDATDRSLSTSVSEMLKAGAGANDIGSIYTGSENGRQNLAIIQDQLRLAQIQNVLKQQNNMADEDQNNFLVNEYGPYINKLKGTTESRKNSAAGVNGGIDMFGSAVAKFLQKDLPTKDDENNNSGNATLQRLPNPDVTPLQNPIPVQNTGVVGVKIPNNNNNILFPENNTTQKTSSGDYDILGGDGFDNFWKTFSYNF